MPAGQRLPADRLVKPPVGFYSPTRRPGSDVRPPCGAGRCDDGEVRTPVQFGGLLQIVVNTCHCARIEIQASLFHQAADRFRAVGPSSVLCSQALPPNPLHCAFLCSSRAKYKINSPSSVLCSRTARGPPGCFGAIGDTSSAESAAPRGQVGQLLYIHIYIYIPCSHM